MQTADEATSDAVDVGRPKAFSEKALASLAATGGMLLVLCAYWTLESYGPSSQVVLYEYLPFRSSLNNLLAAILGAWLGSRAFRLVRPRTGFSGARLVTGCLLGAFLGMLLTAIPLFASSWTVIPEVVTFAIGIVLPGVGAWLCGTFLFKPREPAAHGLRGWLASSVAILIGAWLVYPQFTAFPNNRGVTERAAWAQHHMPQYAYLTRTIEKIPVIQDSVGRVTAIAPASGVQHVTGLTMDGVAMRLVLDVVGEKGTGLLTVNCTIDQNIVFEWQPAIWTASGETTEITTVPNLFRRKS